MKRKQALLWAALVLPAGPATRVIDRENDDPTKLAPRTRMEMNLQRLDQLSRRSVYQTAQPWSDVTWKANKGLVAERWLDGNYQGESGWTSKRRYRDKYSATWALSLPAPERERWIATLSPAEKYDLVMGMAGDGLAHNISSFLDETLGGHSTFPSWWGLCEGSAASTMYYPEPVRKVSLRSEAYGVNVTFYAPDIKGLATMLWSRFNTVVTLPESGLQCKSGSEQSCFDSNPASFHASVHHFLDLHPGILVGEMDPSPVVWNFPLVGFSESYYRPDRGADYPIRDLRSAAIRADQWGWDPRRAKRSPGTAYVVGVKVNLRYGVNHSQVPPREGSLKRQINSRDLVYELELDSGFNLIGGEWIGGKHPDLLWTIPEGATPDTLGDAQLPPGGGENGVIPAAWSGAARASAERLTPLRRVVEILVNRSK